MPVFFDSDGLFFVFMVNFSGAASSGFGDVLLL
jgi:hypothetical protein